MTDPSDHGATIDFGAIILEEMRRVFANEMRARLDANAAFAVTTVTDEAQRFGRQILQAEPGIRGAELVDRIVAHLRGLAEGL